ncbi:MAG TPA: signal peptidase I [Coriobacteriia bacterium]|nr:signal peptidase I [Coriobacteriia bacterium]
MTGTAARLCGVALAAAAVALALMTHGIVVVTGGSMEPALSPGDVCVYRRARTVLPGSVVVFERAGGRGLVVHRALWAGPRGELRTRGDANSVQDPSVVQAADVRGPVVLTIRVGDLRGR